MIFTNGETDKTEQKVCINNLFYIVKLKQNRLYPEELVNDSY